MQGGGRWGRGSVQGNGSDFLRLQSSFLSHTPLRLIIPPPPFPSAPQIPPTSMSYRAACKVVAELGLIHGRAHQHQTQVRAQRQKLLKLSEGVCIFQEVGGYSRASSTLGYPDPPPSPPRHPCCPLPLRPWRLSLPHPHRSRARAIPPSPPPPPSLSPPISPPSPPSPLSPSPTSASRKSESRERSCT